MKKIILVDMDGPLADFEQNFLNRWRLKYPDLPFIPLEDRQTFYVADQYPAEYKPFVKSIYGEAGFFLNHPPVGGAIGALHYLDRYLADVDVFICTSPLSGYNPCVLEKYQWVEKHLGLEFTKKIILTKDKTIVRGDYLVDDKPQITGSMTPTWEHLIFDYPYNQSTPGRHINWVNWQWFLEELHR